MDLFVLLPADSDKQIIFLSGIFKKDIIKKKKRVAQPKIIQYSRPPDKFTNLKSWLKNTNLLCFNCGQSHNNIPIPVSDYMVSNNIFNVHRNILFCSFPCAQYYINNNGLLNQITKDNMSRLLLLIFNIFIDSNPAFKLNIINESNSPYMLPHYCGGGMSYEDFNEYNNSIVNPNIYANKN
jgi:hypothetical protein